MFIHGGIFRVDVTTLDHELLDHSMEQQPIIEMLLHMLNKVVPMLRSLVKQFHLDFPLICLYQHQGFFLLCVHREK